MDTVISVCNKNEINAAVSDYKASNEMALLRGEIRRHLNSSRVSEAGEIYSDNTQLGGCLSRASTRKEGKN